MPKSNFLVALVLFAFVKLSESTGTSAAGSSPPVFCYTTDANCNERSAAWGGACKTGQKQSPINFDVKLVPGGLALMEYLKTPRHVLKFSGYSANSFYIVDNGHTVQITLEPTATSNSNLTGDGVDGQDYVFAQAHLHWGGILGGGSEHTVGGKRYTGEVHLVHYKRAYGSVANAAASGDPHGLAVVGRFIEHDLISPMQLKGDLALGPIIANLPTTYDPNAKQVNKPINLGLFLPKSGDVVLRYDGSLTTPGCNEVVLWNVVAKPLKVNFFELLALHNVHGEEGEVLEKNYRSVQPTNSRQIEKYIVK